MRHLPFFEAIAEHSRDEAVWAEHAAGVLVLRFFESWVDSPAVVVAHEAGVLRLRQLIGELHNLELRHLLGSAVSVLLQEDNGDPTVVVGPFLAYARFLEDVGRYTQALDVLHTIVDAVDPLDGPRDLQLVARTLLRLGNVTHRVRRFDEAESRYNRALELAIAVADLPLELEIRTWQVNLLSTRGNLGEAEQMITEVVDRAKAAGLHHSESFARRVRGSTLHRRGRPNDALQEFYVAYTHASDDTERDLLLSDIAACTAEIGLRRTARLVHETLARTSHNEMTRSLALMNLLEHAVVERDREAFATLWQQIEQRELPADFKLYAYLFHAQGIEVWEDRNTAITKYTELAERARQTGTHHIEFQALEAISRLQHADTPPAFVAPSPVEEPSEGSREIAGAVEAVCSLRLHAAGAAF